MGHEHSCSVCGYAWPCSLKRAGRGKVKLCEVEKAVKVNRAGPLCQLCYHEEMARRIRAARLASGWTVPT